MSLPHFTHDWFTPHQQHLEAALEEYRGRERVRFLEIGCYEGMATLWFLENYLQGEGSLIECIDTFEGGKDHEALGIDFRGVKERFLENVRPYLTSLRLHVGRSSDVLRRLPPGFDVAYVDGSHVARDVLTDAVLTWPLLNSGGLLIFDDYGWSHPDRLQQPRPAIDTFLDLFSPELQLVHKEYRVIVRKK